MKLSGYTVTRDCILGDYCFEETIRSLAAVCDEVVVGDAMSVDGTREKVLELASEIPKVRLVNYEREYPFDDRGFLTRWMNATREMTHGEWQLYLDADEVIDPDDGGLIQSVIDAGSPVWCRRLNFWMDHRHIAPSGVVCGDAVVRLAPRSYWMPSDEPCIPEAQIRVDAKQGGPTIWHYGFIRHAAGFLAKSEWFQPALIGSFDERLKTAKATGQDWRVLAPCPQTPVPYAGHHPKIAHRWLEQRSFIP